MEDPPAIFKTVDGVSWEPQGGNLTLAGSALTGVSVVDSSTAWIAGGLSDGFGVVLRTTDGGASWERMGSGIEIPEGTLCVKAFSTEVAWIGGDGIPFTAPPTAA